MTKRILFIATSHTKLGQTDQTTGVWAEELIVPYLDFLDAGIEVELSTPLGGPITWAQASIKPTGQNEAPIERFLVDPVAQKACQQTHALHSHSTDHFDAIFFPGGHGTMWDLPDNIDVTRTVETALARGQIIASVCHGAAGLVSAKDAHGLPVVKGRRINSFTDAEEAAVGLTQVVPFQLESRLRELGAHFEGAANWQPFALRDGPFITGQNPQSSKVVAQMILQALKGDVQPSI